jgi:hypothetical protein
MNKTEIRNRARTITELEASDVSDTTLDMYIRDGFERMVAIERRWPSYETSTTLTTVANQRDYAVTGLGAGDVREITSLVNQSTGTRLRLISYDQGEEVFMAMGSDAASEPKWFSSWGGSIQLWPKPDAVYTLTVRGYRKPSAWYNFDVVEVDADDRLHLALVYYVVAQLYQLQEDAQMAQFYRQTFDEAVRLAHSDIVRTPSHAPLILSGGDPRWWTD